jgi:hypothetical protein
MMIRQKQQQSRRMLLDAPFADDDDDDDDKSQSKPEQTTTKAKKLLSLEPSTANHDSDGSVGSKGLDDLVKKVKTKNAGDSDQKVQASLNDSSLKGSIHW